MVRINEITVQSGYSVKKWVTVLRFFWERPNMLNGDSMIAYMTYNRQIKFSNIHEYVVVFESAHMKFYHRGT